MSSQPRSKSVTLHDVAAAAEVSLMTASRALRNPELVSKGTRERVQQAVEATGYIPNRLAGGLKSKRSMTIGALVPFIAVPQFLPTVQTLTEELDRAGYQLILGQTGYDHAREAALLDTLLGRRVDGIVVAGLLNSSPASERLRRLGLPVVERLQQVSPIPLDLHLMIDDPARWAPLYAETGAYSVTFHAEATDEKHARHLSLTHDGREYGMMRRRCGSLRARRHVQRLPCCYRRRRARSASTRS